ncbi:hypothetical protein BDW02DRAFT_649639 [Decorospora gaudefroyi]|uniref:Uncharacterized protein n=1 Tax=Decorospora gaudefroyi TaxID=184978 RepID=A0A6A5K6W5_9PLEO|nr:hypothetical protein BDW02DRAFT_649639 [Decorospora gaudefroyi]
MEPKKPSPTSSPSSALHSTLFTFIALYLTTLFSLDTWSSAQNSPYRNPSSGSHLRPNSNPTYTPVPGSYQAGMHGRGNAGPLGNGRGSGGGSGGRDVGRVRDSRPPIKMGAQSEGFTAAN